MAKQKGPVYFTGCSNGITFYKMDGKYYQRRKSSLSGKRVKRDPVFKRTMKYAGLLGQASKLAGSIYRSVPLKDRKHALYRQMTGEAMRMLKQEMDTAHIEEQLKKKYVTIIIVEKDNVAAWQPVAADTPVKKLRIAAHKPDPTPRMKAGRLWISARAGLHELSVHPGDLHDKVFSIRGGRCLVPG